MGIIGRVFARKASRAQRPAQPSGFSSEMSPSDIEKYYVRIISDCLRRLLVQAGMVELVVRCTGAAPSGLSTYAGYVRILRWDAALTPVLLQNLPVLDARIRKVVAASVILEHTRFDGLWFQATAAAEGAPQALLGMPASLVVQRRPAPTSAPPA